MSSRYYTQFSQKKLSATGPRPSPPGSSGHHKFETESTANWPGAPGPKGPKRNTVGFPEVKQAAKQDMADDGKFIQKAIKHPGALHKQLGVPMGQNIPAKKLAAAADKGGLLGQRARLAQTLKKLNK